MTENKHVGTILKEEFLTPLSMSANALAIAIGTSNNRISCMLVGKAGVSADTDLRLCKFFGLEKGYWLRLQNAYDLCEAERKLGSKLDDIKPYVYKNELLILQGRTSPK